MNGLAPSPLDIANMLLTGQCSKAEATEWLASHNTLHARLTTMNLEQDRSLVVSAVIDELARQDATWGVQNHPSFDQVLLNRKGGASHERLAQEYEIPTELRAKQLCALAAKNNELTWMHIAVEELCECLGADDNESLVMELVQLAAVSINWAQCLRRQGRLSKQKELCDA